MTVTSITNTFPAIEGAQMRRHTSFGAVYEGVIEHENSHRFNTYVESVPDELVYPESAIVVCGGYTASREHYRGVQREFGRLGERSVYVTHEKHRGYEIGDNAEDIAETCKALALGGIKRLILVGHSQGAPETLEAHEILRSREVDVEVTDIVLAFPAKFIEKFPLELAKSMPLFAAESLQGFRRNPVKQMRFGFQIVRNIIWDSERIIKEGWDLATDAKGAVLYDRAQSYDTHPKLHLVVGAQDGLIPGNAVLRGLKDKKHDSVTVLDVGHVEMNNSSTVTKIIHAEVRRLGKKAAA